MLWDHPQIYTYLLGWSCRHCHYFEPNIPWFQKGYLEARAPQFFVVVWNCIFQIINCPWKRVNPFQAKLQHFFFYINLLLSMEVIYTQFYKCWGRVWGRVVAKAGDRLWLDMCQLMIWQEQIKRWVCLWETRSSKLEAVTDSLFLWQTVCICDRPSVSVTDRQTDSFVL